ncbi:type I methionyl aminopeptidase [[Clostridium] colinum]|uniref:type I methionyl aminopeptidase n=1 Tax=[Clostridium] colinum TaxID=36835 RepID=UPI002023F179|nr:type I methionyl aminopeptidase [[Clostridium] colinum]
MAITIKNEKHIDYMKEAGKINSEVLNLLESYIKPGISTKELDKIAFDFIKSKDAIPSFKGYGGFPATICASVNNQLIHGIPSDILLKEGDIISIDVGTYKNKFHADAARTFAVGNISDEAKKLIDITKQSFFEGIKFAKVGYYLYDISSAIQKYVEDNGFSIVRDYVGHGIGKNLHEDPQIPNYRPFNKKGPKLIKGMTLAIEPMVNVGARDIKVLQDGWTVVTKDGSLSAHYENTVLITEDEPDILTL